MNILSKLTGRLVVTALFLLGLALGVAGCSSGEQEGAISKNTAYTVTDARGKAVTLAGKPQRIISLSVFSDEVLLDLVDHERIAGLDKWVHDPGLSMGAEQAKDVTTIVEKNMESIIALGPDLVILPDATKADFVESLEDVGLKVFVYQAATRAHEIPAMVHTLGQVVGETERAAQLNKAMEARLAQIQAKVDKLPAAKKERALLFLRFGAIGGEGSIYHDTMTLAGLEDCYNEARPEGQVPPGMSRVLSKEEVVKANPQLIIVSSWSHGTSYEGSEHLIQEMYQDPAYADVEAIKQQNIIVVPQGYVNCLSHNIATAVEKLHEAVYEK